MTDEDHGDPVALGEVHQAERRLADLADAPGRARRARRPSPSGSNRRRPDRVARTAPPPRSDRRRARRGPGRRRPTVPVEQAQTCRPQPDLAGRLLARGVQHRRHRPSARVSPAAAWSRSVDLPIPGSPPSRTSEPGTSPPPSTRSSSSMPRPQARQVGVGDRRPGPRRGRPAAGRARRDTALRPRRLADDRLDQAVPAAAGAALAFPAQERLRAGLADEAALGPRHR